MHPKLKYNIASSEFQIYTMYYVMYIRSSREISHWNILRSIENVQVISPTSRYEGHTIIGVFKSREQLRTYWKFILILRTKIIRQHNFCIKIQVIVYFFEKIYKSFT